jgi:hypothetical protein
MAERAVDLMPGGVECVLSSARVSLTIGRRSLLFCVDLSGKPKTQSGAMSVNRQILSILQTHYVVRNRSSRVIAYGASGTSWCCCDSFDALDRILVFNSSLALYRVSTLSGVDRAD